MMQQGPGEQTQKPKQQLAPIGRNVATDVPLRSDSRNDLHPSRSESKNSVVAADMYRMELEKQIEEKRERDARWHFDRSKVPVFSVLLHISLNKPHAAKTAKATCEHPWSHSAMN
jgi:hypothetical protein